MCCWGRKSSTHSPARFLSNIPCLLLGIDATVGIRDKPDGVCNCHNSTSHVPGFGNGQQMIPRAYCLRHSRVAAMEEEVCASHLPCGGYWLYAHPTHFLQNLSVNTARRRLQEKSHSSLGIALQNHDQGQKPMVGHEPSHSLHHNHTRIRPCR